MRRRDFPRQRVVLGGELVFQTPVHVGGFGSDPDTDLPLARDGADQFVIPGTSIAGALRDWCQRMFDEADVNAVWGFIDPKDPLQGHASRVCIHDLPIPEDLSEELRDGVGIDRLTGAAADRFKYDRTILPSGTRLRFRLVAEPFSEHVPAAPMLAALRNALAAAEIRLGAGKTRGLGRVALEKHHLQHFQALDKSDGILALLEGASADLDAAPLPLKAGARTGRLALTINWQPEGPLMVKSGADGVGVDGLPLLSRAEQGRLAPVLPGSSIKGAFRMRAERIIRTLLTIRRCDNFQDQLNVPLVDSLFGSRALGRQEQPPRHPSLGLGALSFDDCVAKVRIEPAQWAKVVRGDRRANGKKKITGSVFIEDALTSDSMDHWSIVDRVAIDRWTGGAGDALLFSNLEPHQVEWEPIRATVRLDRLPEDERLPAVTLLMLVVRDLAGNCLPLGFGSNRGWGAVGVESVGMSCDVIPELNRTLARGNPAELAGFLDPTWNEWLVRHGGAR